MSFLSSLLLSTLIIQGTLAADPISIEDGFQTSFLDTFDGPRIDNSLWTIVEGNANDDQDYCNRGFTCTEEVLPHYYSDSQVKIITNLEQTNGYAMLKAVDTYDRWYTGKMTTESTYKFKYGRVDVRMSAAVHGGAFPTISLIPVSNEYGGWPKSGEIKLFQNRTVQSRSGNIFTPFSIETENRFESDSMNFGNSTKSPLGYNIYTVDWTSARIDFYQNRELIGRYSKPKDATPADWPFDQEFYLSIDLPVVPVEDDDNLQPSVILVDWIRVSQSYQRPTIASGQGDGIHLNAMVNYIADSTKTDGSGYFPNCIIKPGGICSCSVTYVDSEGEETVRKCAQTGYSYKHMHRDVCGTWLRPSKEDPTSFTCELVN